MIIFPLDKYSSVVITYEWWLIAKINDYILKKKKLYQPNHEITFNNM
jgi:hypothetical protein